MHLSAVSIVDQGMFPPFNLLSICIVVINMYCNYNIIIASPLIFPHPHVDILRVSL